MILPFLHEVKGLIRYSALRVVFYYICISPIILEHKLISFLSVKN